MSKKWTAEDWSKATAAALAAKASALRLQSDLDQHRPRFTVKRGATVWPVAHVTDEGALMMAGTEVVLSPAEVVEFRSWLGTVFPCVPRVAEVVR